MNGEKSHQFLQLSMDQDQNDFMIAIGNVDQTSQLNIKFGEKNQ